MSLVLEKPEKPGLSECCGGGSCCPCVWDAYFEELRRWNEWRQSQELVETEVTTDDDLSP